MSAVDLVLEVRRIALVQTLRTLWHDLTLAQLAALVSRGKYAAELGTITVGELQADGPPVRRVPLSPDDLLASVRRWVKVQDRTFSSADVRRRFGIQRWTAQAVLKTLEAEGVAERSGSTSATRWARC